MILNSTIWHIELYQWMQESNGEEMVSDFLDGTREEELHFLHVHEWSFAIAFYYFPNANHYVIDKTWTALNGLSVFAYPGSAGVIDIGDAANIAAYTDEFYIFDQKFPHQEAPAESHFTDETLYQIDDAAKYQIIPTSPRHVSIRRVQVLD